MKIGPFEDAQGKPLLLGFEWVYIQGVHRIVDNIWELVSWVKIKQKLRLTFFQ